MKKLIIIITILVGTMFTGCTGMGDYNQELGVFTRYEEFTDTSDYYNGFDLSDNKLFMDIQADLEIGIHNYEDRPYVTFSRPGIYNISTLIFRSKSLNKQVEIDNPSTTAFTFVSTGSGFNKSKMSAKISKEDAKTILEILQKDDFKIKIESIHDYIVLTHTKNFGVHNARRAANLVKLIK
jgi:hypothetical protein